MLSSGFVSAPRPSRGDPAQGECVPGRPFGIYVHFPFCSVHCPYCDFAVDARAAIPHDAYARAVQAELAARRAWFRPAAAREGEGMGPLVSLYFGGGTPGLWRADALGDVIDAVRTVFDVGAWQGQEITVEANPGEVTREHFEALRRRGVNRVSVGVQSLDDDLLSRIGRNHDAASVAPAFKALRQAGIERLSADLMYGLPGQSLQSWQRSVEAVCDLRPDHISAYALTVERGTKFGALERSGRLQRPDDDAVAAMFEWGRDALRGAGYEQYEVSSYALAGRRAVHNALYWSGGAYLGVGASAASFRPLADGGGWRFTNPRSTDTYLRAVQAGDGNPAPAQVERRSVADLENEALWLGLRTVEGIDRQAHSLRFGRDPLAVAERAIAAARCSAAGWLAVTEAAVRLTREGFLFADEVAGRLWQ